MSPNHTCGVFQKLVPLLRDLVKVNFKTLRQLDQDVLTHDRGEILLAVSAAGWVVLFTWRLRRYQFPPLPRHHRTDALELSQELAKQRRVLTGTASRLDTHLASASFSQNIDI